jgi:ketosteroid isomerase-like protein
MEPLGDRTIRFRHLGTRDTAQAVSEENVELARRMIEWFNAGDAEAAQAHATDDVEIVPLRAVMEDTTYRGPEAFAAFMSDNDESWAEIRFEAEAFRDAGERVVAIGQLAARARLTEADVKTRLAMLIEFEGARVSRAETYVDIAAALQAAGLSG